MSDRTLTVTPTTAPDQSSRRRVSPKTAEGIAGYIFLSPFIAGLLLFGAIPIGASLWLSFTNYNLLSPPKWIGTENYTSLFSDPHYIKSLQVTLTYVGISVPVQLALALIIAVLLNRGLRGLSIYRAVFYVPSLLGGSVAIVILWRQLFAADGIVNSALRFLGWHSPPIWLFNPDWTLYTLILLSVWQFGAPMIIFLAGLRQIPRDYYEAAEVDSAGKIAQFLHITVPLITPLVLFNLVMGVIGAFQAFTSAYIISGGQGGPLDATMFYTLYLYIQGFTYLHMGYAAAMAWILLIIIAVFTAIIFTSSKHWVFYMEQAK